MTKQEIQAKLSDLTERKQQMLANLNAISGAMQLCGELLREETEREERQESEDVVKDSND